MRGIPCRSLAWLALVAAPACEQFAEQATPAGAEGSGVAIPQPTTGFPVTSRDQEVLDHVLRDLIADTTDRSPVAMRGKPPERLSVASCSASWPITIEQVLHRQDVETWAQLPEDALPELQLAAADLVARSTPGFVGFESTDWRMTSVRDADANSAALRTRAGRPIRAWPPGFSADGTLAVVRLSIPWSRHSATATYVLSSEEQPWAILVRQYAIRF